VTTSSWHLAQLNIARLRQPIDHPDFAEFIDALEHINGLGEASQGFVLRLHGDIAGGDPGDQFHWDRGDSHGVIWNLTVWTDFESLKAFAYQGEHKDYFRRRGEWFVRHPEATTVLWWVPAGHQPDLPESDERLRRLRADGPTPHAFTMTRRFAPPAEG